MTTGRVVRLRFPARSEFLLLPRLALAGVARACPMPEETLADLKLAVTEACGNAVRHAYGDEEGVIRVGIEFSPTSVRITVEDDGRGIPSDPGRADAPVVPGRSAENEGGMGLSIIKAIADHLEIGPPAVAGHGTRIAFTKDLPREAGAETDASSFPEPDPPATTAGDGKQSDGR